MSIRYQAVGVGALLAVAGVANAFTISNVADRPTLLAGTPVPLDLSSRGLTGTNGNEFVAPISSVSFSGELKVEVFGNAPAFTTGLNDVVMIYTFTGDSNIFGIEGFSFGVDSSVEIDFADINGSTQGRVTADVTGGQADPGVTVTDNVGSNDTWDFDYTSDNIGGADGDETFTWYIRTGGDIDVSFVDVLVTDFGGITIQAPALVNRGGGNDLDVPAPGVASLLGLAGLAAARRRR
jgi:hypothetical protein